MVLGVKICGNDVEDFEVALDSAFKAVPIPSLLGVPLAYKRCESSSETPGSSDVVCRLMAEPQADGMPTMGSPKEEKGTVLLVRQDKLPFSRPDCTMLDLYVHQFAEMAAEWREMSDQWAEVSARFLKPEAFQKFLKQQLALPANASNALAFLSIRFPTGSIVTPNGLSTTDLNGVEGRVVQYTRDRVGVKFPHGVVAVRPERLTLLRLATETDEEDESESGDEEAPEESQHAAVSPPQPQAVSPPQKQECSGIDGIERSVKQMVARQIANCFVESVQNDALPLDAEREFWGLARIGEDIGKNEIVFRAWTGLVRHEMVTEACLAAALVCGSVKQLFEEQCRLVAKDGFPVIEGVKPGLGNTADELLSACERLAVSDFLGLEWETME